MTFKTSAAAYAFLVGTIGLAGCTSVTLAPRPYHAYGDSITFGYSLAAPATQAYPALVSVDEGVAFANYASGGSQACDIPTNQIFAHKDAPSLASPSRYSVLIGTNDADLKGTGAYEQVFFLCHKAILSWLGVPAEYKVLATDSAVTATGAGSIDASDHWNAWTTGGLGSAMSFPITTTVSGPIYLWPRISDTNPATYTYSLDGVVLGSGNTQTTPAIATYKGTTNSLGFIRLSAVQRGLHVVTFTQTSAGANGVSVVGIGTPTGSASGTMPTVLVGTVPYQYNDGQCTVSSDEPCLEYTQDIEADVNLFSADGLDVRLFDTRKYMLGTAAEMDDNLHPSALGQIHLSQAVEAVW